jgi:hypothetical protein
MFSFVARSANLSSVTVALVPPPAQKLTTNSLTAGLPINPIRASVSIGGNIFFFLYKTVSR